MLTSSRSQVTMASNKVMALGFIVLMSMGLANAARVARYSSADGTGTGGGWGGGYVNRAGLRVQGLGPSPAQVRAVQVVSIQVLEGV